MFVPPDWYPEDSMELDAVLAQDSGCLGMAWCDLKKLIDNKQQEQNLCNRIVNKDQ